MLYLVPAEISLVLLLSDYYYRKPVMFCTQLVQFPSLCFSSTSILFLSFFHVEGMIAMTAISLLKALRLLPWLVEPDKHDQDHLEPLR